jgi:hypothetical protein
MALRSARPDSVPAPWQRGASDPTVPVPGACARGGVRMRTATVRAAARSDRTLHLVNRAISVYAVGSLALVAFDQRPPHRGRRGRQRWSPRITWPSASASSPRAGAACAPLPGAGAVSGRRA